MKASVALLFLAVAVELARVSRASIYEFEHVSFGELEPEPVFAFSEGGIRVAPILQMLDQQQSIQSAADANSRFAYIAIDAALRVPARSLGNSTAKVHIVLARADRFETLGYKSKNAPRTAPHAMCCTEAIAREQEQTRDAADLFGASPITESTTLQNAHPAISCSANTIGSLIIEPRTRFSALSGGARYTLQQSVVPLTLDGEDKSEVVSARIDRQFSVVDSGVYTLLVASCGAPDASMSARIVVHNAHGFLPGHLYGLLRVFSWLYIAYACVAAIWTAMLIVASIRATSVSVSAQSIGVAAPTLLHAALSGLLFIGLFETLLLRHAYVSANDTGEPLSAPLPVALVLGTALSVLRRAAAKALILMLAAGWGITRPTFPIGFVRAVVLLASLSAVFALAHEVSGSARGAHAVGAVAQSRAVALLLTLLTDVPLALLDLALGVWVFSELAKTRSLVRERGHSARLSFYRMFTLALVFFLAVGVTVLVVTAVLASRAAPHDRWHRQHWQSFFLFGGLPSGGAAWDIAGFGLLVALLALFAPGRAGSAALYSRASSDGREESDGAAGSEPFMLSSMEHMSPSALPAGVDVKEFFTLEDD